MTGPTFFNKNDCYRKGDGLLICANDVLLAAPSLKGVYSARVPEVLETQNSLSKLQMWRVTAY